MTTKRVAGLVLSVLGIALALFALVYGNLRDTEKKITAKSAASESVFVYTETGVLDLVEPKVTVELTAAEGKVVWGLAKTQDAVAYIGKSSATKITGLKNWTTLSTAEVAGDEAASTADVTALKDGTLNFLAAPIWEESGEGEGSAKVALELNPELARSLVATTTTGVAPELSFTWIKSTGDFPLLQYLLCGLLAALIGLYLLFTEGLARNRIDYFRKREAGKQEKRDAFASAETSVLPVFEGDLADPQLDRDVQKQHTDAAFGAAILPGTSRTIGLRERELPESERILLGDLTPENYSATADENYSAESDSEGNTEENIDENRTGFVDSSETLTDSGDAVEGKAAENSDVKGDWKALWDFDVAAEDAVVSEINEGELDKSDFAKENQTEENAFAKDVADESEESTEEGGQDA
ncbi:MAG: hypothetical protein SPG61_01630 [Arcanobacterium sp.]|nr:hypothetical protein [Arcanobacterium sp.]